VNSSDRYATGMWVENQTIYYINGRRQRECRGVMGHMDGRCLRCGARVESSGGICGVLVDDIRDGTDTEPPLRMDKAEDLDNWGDQL